MKHAYTPTARQVPEGYEDHIRRVFGDTHHGRLTGYVGRRVNTPKGPGILEQIFPSRAGVTLDSETGKPIDKVKMTFFKPERVTPC